MIYNNQTGRRSEPLSNMTCRFISKCDSPQNEMTPGQRVVHVVAVVQIESFFGAKSVPQAAQLDGIRFLMTEQRIRRIVPGRFRPQLILARVRIPHLQVVQSNFHTVPGALVRPDGERFALYIYVHKQTGLFRVRQYETFAKSVL